MGIPPCFGGIYGFTSTLVISNMARLAGLSLATGKQDATRRDVFMAQGRGSLDNGGLDNQQSTASGKSGLDDSVRQSLVNDSSSSFSRADSPGDSGLHTGRARYGVPEGIPGLTAPEVNPARDPGVNSGRGSYGVPEGIPGLTSSEINPARDPGANTGRGTYGVPAGIPGLTDNAPLPLENRPIENQQPSETQLASRASTIEAEEARQKTREHIDSYLKFQPSYYGNRLTGGVVGMLAGVTGPRTLDNIADWYLDKYPAPQQSAPNTLNGNYTQPKANAANPANSANPAAPAQPASPPPIPKDFTVRTYESGGRGWAEWAKDNYGRDCNLRDLVQSRGSVYSSIKSIRDDLAIQTKAVAAKQEQAVEMMLQGNAKAIWNRGKFLLGDLSIDDAEQKILEGGKKLTGEKALITLDDAKLVAERNNFLNDPVQATKAQQQIHEALSQWDDLKIVRDQIDQVKNQIPQTPKERMLLGRQLFLDHIDPHPMMKLTADEVSAIKAGKPLLPGFAENLSLQELKDLQKKLNLSDEAFTWKMNKSGITPEDIRVMAEREKFTDLVKNYRGAKIGTLTELGVHFARGWAVVSLAEMANDVIDRKFFNDSKALHDKPSWHTDMAAAPLAFSLPLFRSFGPNAVAAAGVYVGAHYLGKKLDTMIPVSSNPEWHKVMKPSGLDAALVAAAGAWPMKSLQARALWVAGAYAAPKIYRAFFEGDSAKTMDDKVNELWDRDKTERSAETLTQSVEQLKQLGAANAHGLKALTEYETNLVGPRKNKPNDLLNNRKVYDADELVGHRRNAGILIAGGEHLISNGWPVGSGNGGKTPLWTEEPLKAAQYLLFNNPEKDRDSCVLPDKQLDLAGAGMRKLLKAQVHIDGAIREVERKRSENGDATHNGTPVRAEEVVELEELRKRAECGIIRSRDEKHDIQGAFLELEKYAFSVSKDTYFKKLYTRVGNEAVRQDNSSDPLVTPEYKAKLWRDKCLVEAAFIGAKINYLGVDKKTNFVDPVSVSKNMAVCKKSLEKALGYVANHPDNEALQMLCADLESELAKRLDAFQKDDRYNIVNGNNAQPWK